MTNAHSGAGPWAKLLKIVRVRWRLFFAAAIVLVSFAVLPSEWRPVTRMLMAWDIGVAVYLVTSLSAAIGTDTNHIRRQSVLHDEGRVAIPVLSATAALASLGAIIVEFTTAPAGQRLISLAFAAGTILLSWTFIQLIFAFHYAYEFYAEHRGQTEGLGFPGDKAPDYWDFLYFSFVIGMTSQVSDVTVRSKPLRRTVTAHALLSFVFNLMLLALAINLAASAIGNMAGP